MTLTRLWRVFDVTLTWFWRDFDVTSMWLFCKLLLELLRELFLIFLFFSRSRATTARSWCATCSTSSATKSEYSTCTSATKASWNDFISTWRCKKALFLLYPSIASNRVQRGKKQIEQVDKTMSELWKISMSKTSELHLYTLCKLIWTQKPSATKRRMIVICVWYGVVTTLLLVFCRSQNMESLIESDWLSLVNFQNCQKLESSLCI